MIFRNSMIMLDAVDLGPLDKYTRKIQKYFARYGLEAWANIYQADVRARGELAESWQKASWKRASGEVAETWRKAGG